MWHKVTNKFNVIAIICDNFTIQNLSQKKKKKKILSKMMSLITSVTIQGI